MSYIDGKFDAKGVWVQRCAECGVCIHDSYYDMIEGWQPNLGARVGSNNPYAPQHFIDAKGCRIYRPGRYGYPDFELYYQDATAREKQQWPYL